MTARPIGLAGTPLGELATEVGSKRGANREINNQPKKLNSLPAWYSSTLPDKKGPDMKHSEGFLKLVDDAKSRIREVSVAQTRERLKANPAAQLIDVREDDEWRQAHAAGAAHLGKGIIERDIEVQVPVKATELILYCGGGYRSALAADALQRMGYTNVFSMAGGWKAWQEGGAPIEQ
jgi:rhodanese-related sulfurtransferase